MAIGLWRKILIGMMGTKFITTLKMVLRPFHKGLYATFDNGGSRKQNA